MLAGIIIGDDIGSDSSQEYIRKFIQSIVNISVAETIAKLNAPVEGSVSQINGEIKVFKNGEFVPMGLGTIGRTLLVNNDVKIDSEYLEGQIDEDQ